MDYTYRVSDDFYATLGGNVMNINPEITKRDEPIYEGVDEALNRVGTANRCHVGPGCRRPVW